MFRQFLLTYINQLFFKFIKKLIIPLINITKTKLESKLDLCFFLLFLETEFHYFITPFHCFDLILQLVELHLKLLLGHQIISTTKKATNRISSPTIYRCLNLFFCHFRYISSYNNISRVLHF